MSLNKKRENPSYTMPDGLSEKLKNEEPIRKGCQNPQCFCTGDCMEITGWRPINQHSLSPSDWINQITEEKSHFEDIEENPPCKHPEHEPPCYLHIPQGKRYVHICPSCRQRSVIQPPQISY